MMPVTLDRDVCYRALQARDARFDGRLFVAVRTTGIYCRPICPARCPKLENVVFYRSAAAAQEAGFKRSETIHGVRLEGTDKPGLGAKIARTLADNGINFRGMQANVIGKNFLSFVALDSADDAAKAVKALRKL